MIVFGVARHGTPDWTGGLSLSFFFFISKLLFCFADNLKDYLSPVSDLILLNNQIKRSSQKMMSCMYSFPNETIIYFCQIRLEKWATTNFFAVQDWSVVSELIRALKRGKNWFSAISWLFEVFSMHSTFKGTFSMSANIWEGKMRGPCRSRMRNKSFRTGWSELRTKFSFFRLASSSFSRFTSTTRRNFNCNIQIVKVLEWVREKMTLEELVDEKSAYPTEKATYHDNKFSLRGMIKPSSLFNTGSERCNTT